MRTEFLSLWMKHTGYCLLSMSHCFRPKMLQLAPESIIMGRFMPHTFTSIAESQLFSDIFLTVKA